MKKPEKSNHTTLRSSRELEASGCYRTDLLARSCGSTVARGSGHPGIISTSSSLESPSTPPPPWREHLSCSLGKLGHGSQLLRNRSPATTVLPLHGLTEFLWLSTPLACWNLRSRTSPIPSLSPLLSLSVSPKKSKRLLRLGFGAAADEPSIGEAASPTSSVSSAAVTSEGGAEAGVPNRPICEISVLKRFTLACGMRSRAYANSTMHLLLAPTLEKPKMM